MENKIKKCVDNITVNITQTDKYTNVIYQVVFLQNYSKMWKYSQFICEMISKCNNVHKTMEEEYQSLYKLYGSAIYCGKYANYQTCGLRFTLDVINKEIVNEPDLYDECYEELKNMIFNPHTKIISDELIEFDAKDLKEAKDNAINEIVNEANDKKKYATSRFFKKFCTKEEFPFVIKLSISEVKKLKSIDLFNFYNYVINNSKVIINVVGNVSEDEVDKLINKLNLKSTNIDLLYEDTNLFIDCKSKRITEKANIKQAHVYLGYRTDIMYRHELYPAYLLFNIMFGELPSSTLFSSIREEQGLAYSVYSSILPIRNILYIYAGVDNKNCELTIKSIKNLLKMYSSGEILKEENREYFNMLLEASKNELKNEYLNGLDNQNVALSNDMKDSIVKRRGLKELYEDSSKCSLEDIVNASKHLYLDTIYVLRGE